MIYVTHDQVEAMTLADKIVVLRDGRIEQVGAPVELYDNPANKFVAQFIGSPKMNFFGTSDLAMERLPGGVGTNQEAGIRPEHLRRCGTDESQVSGKLELVENLGEVALVHLQTPQGTDFIAKMEKPPAESKGETLHFATHADTLHVFDAASGLRA